MSLIDYYAVAGGGGPGFLTVTIAHGMFPSTQTDIEIWFSFTDSSLKTVANGGHVVNANHRRFASNSAGTSLYKYDIVTPTATTDSTGLIEGFFLLPSGSSSVDTVLYLAYNDNGVTSYQGDRAGMWARKIFVNHGSDGTTIDLTDASGNQTTLTNNNGVTATAGQIGGAANFASASSQSETVTLATAPSTDHFTLSAWVRYVSGSDMAILAVANPRVTQRFIAFELNIISANIWCFFTQGGDTFRIVTGATSLAANTWYWLVGTYDGTNEKVYVNGVQDGSQAFSGNVESGQNRLAVGCRGGIAESFFNGKINAPRVDVTHADSADRILAQYRNQSAPATYITAA